MNFWVKIFVFFIAVVIFWAETERVEIGEIIHILFFQIVSYGFHSSLSLSWR